jgi:hypothetical protein
MNDERFEREIEEKICSEWKIDGSVIHRPFKFTRPPIGHFMIPECYDDQKLHVKIGYSGTGAEDCRTLVHHEGAHIYLFHLRYPPSRFDMDTYEFIADYYACCLQMKKYPRDLDDLLLLQNLYNGVGQAMHHAIMQYLGQASTQPAAVLKNYKPVEECLRNAPPPPVFGSASFDAGQIKKVQELLSRYYPIVYQKTINFSIPRC